MSAAYTLGIDAGSRFTKFALINGNEIAELTSRPTTWKTKELVETETTRLSRTFNIDPDNLQIIATGYGRNTIPANAAVTEITCHARGAHYLNPTAGTVIDIGGQDSKIIVLGPRGTVTDFLMNDKCAAGTGKFIEIMLQTLNENFADLDKLIKNTEPIKITSTCAVFAESEIIGLMASGADRSAVLAGVISASAEKVAALAGRLTIRQPIFLSGGLAHSTAMQNALSQKLEIPVTTAPHAWFAGAIGAALCQPKQPGK